MGVRLSERIMSDLRQLITDGAEGGWVSRTREPVCPKCPSIAMAKVKRGDDGKARAVLECGTCGYVEETGQVVEVADA